MQTRRSKIYFVLLFFALPTGFCFSQQDRTWTNSYLEENASFSPHGTNPYFILEPGYQSQFKGKEEGKSVELIITVLNKTTVIDGIETGIVEERETADGELIEVSRNFFAISKRTNGVYYFGEDVDMYKKGIVVNHEGSWRSGAKGAHYGLVLPGIPLAGSRYYQELAPGVAMDRSEILSVNERLQTPVGAFDGCLKTEETTPLEPQTKEYKYYAKGVSLIQDGTLCLVRHIHIKN